jgi:hypothetical protein
VRSQTWIALLLMTGAAGCRDAALARRKVADHEPAGVVVAADRFASRIDDDALRAHVSEAKTLAEALEWTVPRMGDVFLADKMFAARDIPMIGGELFASWADTHLRWADVSISREIDLAHAVNEAAPFRGLTVCVRGSFAAPDLSHPREVTFVTHEQGWTLFHDVHLAGEIPVRHTDVKLCGVVVGRRIVSSKERPGLVLIGMARDEPAPSERPLEETIDELFGEEPPEVSGIAL